MRNTIFASFAEPKFAERAAGALMDHGLRPEDLSIIQSHKWRAPLAEDIAPVETPEVLYVVPNSRGVSTGESPFGNAPMVAVVDEVIAPHEQIDTQPNYEEMAKHGISTTTRQDASSGALKGTAWGVGVGAVAALASLLIPGVGIVVGGGALATAVAGIAATAGAGAAAGALTGYLKDQGIESHVAAEYEMTIQTGGALLGVTIPSGQVDEARAWDILNKYAGKHVTSYVNRPYVI